MVRTASTRSLAGLIPYQGNTPLHLAADRGHIEVARLLLGAGADRQARVSVGKGSKLTLGRRRADTVAAGRDIRQGGHDRIVEIVASLQHD